MRFLVLSDIHGNLENLELLDDEFANADAVICAGDFAKFGAPETGLPVLNTLVKKHDNLLCVLGNCDDPSFMQELENLDVSVQGDVVYRDSFLFAGSGGGLFFTGTTPYERTEDELSQDLIAASNEIDSKNLIVISHQPPHGTKADIIESGAHVGSLSIKKFIDDYQPAVVITGHIHEAFSIDHVGETLVINPGSLDDGRYAILEMEVHDNGKPHIITSKLRTV